MIYIMLICRTNREWTDYGRYRERGENYTSGFTTTTTTLPMVTSSSSSSSNEIFLYYGGTYVLEGWEFSDGIITGSTVTYDLVNNTVSLDDPNSVTYISCNTESGMDGNLDVSNCPNLTNFDCHNNLFASVNVQGCNSLYWFDCGQNNLTSIDVSNLTTLYIFYCYNNNLTSLDVSTCTSLNYLRCDSNSITALNLLGCTNLITLQCENNLLPESSIDTILSDLVTNGVNGGGATMNGTGNEGPSDAGWDNRTILLSAPRNWTNVDVNDTTSSSSSSNSHNS